MLENYNLCLRRKINFFFFFLATRVFHFKENSRSCQVGLLFFRTEKNSFTLRMHVRSPATAAFTSFLAC